jgi:hypothetical protein
LFLVVGLLAVIRMPLTAFTLVLRIAFDGRWVAKALQDDIRSFFLDFFK